MTRYPLIILFFLVSLVSAFTQITFNDVTEAANIDHYFKVDLATFGGGVAVIDYDNDGWEDLYLTGGANPDALYRNMGDGTFMNVMAATEMFSQLNVVTQGVASADVNKDGFRDLLITTLNVVGDNSLLLSLIHI